MKRKALAMGAVVTLVSVAGNSMAAEPAIQCDSVSRLQVELDRMPFSSPSNQKELENFKRATRNLMVAYGRLSAVSESKSELLVCFTGEINARVTRRGEPVLVMAGLLVKYGQEEDFLAAVLAHELGHLERDHAGYYERALGVFRYQANAAGKAEFYRSGDLKRAMSSAVRAFQAQRFAFSREQETDADSFAAILLTRAGYKTDAIVRMMSKFLLDEGNAPSRWFSTHPGWAERLDRVEPRVADEEADQVVRRLSSSGDIDALARRINLWLAQFPDSGNAWFHKAAFLQRLGLPRYLEAYELALSSQAPSLSRTNEEMDELWFSLCVGLFHAGRKLESAECSRYIGSQALSARFRSSTFGDLLFMGGPPPPGTSLLATRRGDGSKLITNDQRLLRDSGLSGRPITPWRSSHFPSEEVLKPLPERSAKK